MMHRMCFCEKIGKIEATGFPSDLESMLLDLISNPMIAHIDGFGALLDESVISEADRAEIVAKNFSIFLRITQVFQSVNDADSGLADNKCR